MTSLSIITFLISVIIASIVVKYSARDFLFIINANTQYIIPWQIAYLVIVAVIVSGANFLLLRSVIRNTENSNPALAMPLVSNTPAATVSNYYMALNDGVIEGNFWHAYDLWSTNHQARYTYDQLKLTHSRIRNVHIKNLQVTAQDDEHAVIVALVYWITEANGMIQEKNEWIHHNLIREQGQWRVDSSDPNEL